MTISRKLGWIADRPHQRPTARFSAPRDAVISDIRPWSVRRFVQGISDQRQLGACTGVSTVRLIQTWDAAHGVASPTLGSALAAYWGGRYLDWIDSGAASGLAGDQLVAAFEAQDSDAGSSHSSVFTAIQQLGLPPESAWPYSDTSTGTPTDAFRERPSAEAQRLAFDARDITFLSIGGEDRAQKILDLNHAGMASCPIAIGILVDETFVQEAFDPGVAYTPDVSKPVGGHALYLIDMRIDPKTGAREYAAAMSWGAGPFSFVWLSEDAVLASSTQLTTVSRAPIVDAGGAS